VVYFFVAFCGERDEYVGSGRDLDGGFCWSAFPVMLLCWLREIENRLLTLFVCL
jgi:hypothetical protein